MVICVPILCSREKKIHQKKKVPEGLVLWCPPVILTLGRLREECPSWKLGWAHCKILGVGFQGGLSQVWFVLGKLSRMTS